MRHAYFAMVGLLSLGCGSDPGAEASSSDDLTPPAEGAGFQLTHSVEVPPGVEQVMCRRFVAGATLDIAAFEHRSTDRTHHVILYRDPDFDPGAVTDQAFECGEIAGPLLYGSQKRVEQRGYPSGIGFPVAAGEVLRLELHTVNTDKQAHEIGVRLNLLSAPEPITREAGSLFFYHRDILIPAKSPATARLRCEIPQDIQIPYLTPHTHKLGIRFHAEIDGVSVLESRGYGDLDAVTFDPPLLVRAGQTLEIACDYANDRDAAVVEGPSRDNNEMCLLIGSYFPRLDFAAENCTRVGSGPLKSGTKSCGQALSCFSATTDDVAREACWLDVCPASAAALNDVGNCGYNLCNTECFDGGDDCQPCVVEHCGDAVTACFESTC